MKPVLRNPYRNRSAIRSASDFFGRATEIGKIYERIVDGSSVSMIGERRVGKSSILNALDFPTIREEFDAPSELRFIFIDMHTIGGCREDELLAYMIFQASSALDLEGGETRRHTLRRIATDALSRRLKPVVLLDEFDVLVHNREVSVGFLGFLRSWTSEFRIPFVVASREGTIDPVVTPEVGSSFLNIFSPLYVGPFEPAEAAELLREPATEAGAPFSKEEIDWIEELGGLHPLFLQVAACHLFDLRQSDMRGDMRDALRREFEFEAGPQFDYLRGRLSPIELDALTRWLTGKGDLDRRVMERLLRMGVLIHNPRGGLRVFSAVFQEQLVQSPSPGAPRSLLASVRNLFLE